jgi:hypothetical protein
MALKPDAPDQSPFIVSGNQKTIQVLRYPFRWQIHGLEHRQYLWKISWRCFQNAYLIHRQFHLPLVLHLRP